MTTAKAYDLWAEVYDTDGNFLQALDTVEIRSLLPRMLRLVQQEHTANPKPCKFVDLGCGTGRNTAALLEADRKSTVVGLDVSPGMLEVARKRLEEFDFKDRLTLDVFNMLEPLSLPKAVQNADGIVSTLVIEHVPADVFFATAAEILRPGGILLLTNMHSDMGRISQAGFVDPKTGDKIRPTSYAHTVNEVEDAAKQHGFEILEPLLQREVDQSMVGVLGHRSEKWVGIMVWFGGLFRKRPM
jgi:SAM-dependent methyltransferase